jgi:hypothetical protein
MLQLLQTDTSTVIGPYLQLITEMLYPAGGEPLFQTFLMNIQYYNQDNYYITYEHLFSDVANGPYSMTQSASCRAIQNYFQSVYGDTIPSTVVNSIVVGKLLTPEAGDSGYVDLGTLAGWFTDATSDSIGYGGYMFWSAGFYTDTYPSTDLVTGTFGSVAATYKVIYIGSGETGQVFTADGTPLFAQASDPDGSNARTILESYASAGFNVLILAFWNFDYESDWVIDWSSITSDNQSQLISDLRVINPECRVLVSGGGAYGNVGPNSGVSGDTWGRAIAQYAVDNHLDGVDLDLEGAMLGVQWTSDQYTWLSDAVTAIHETDSDLMLSFAPVAPLCANPN